MTVLQLISSQGYYGAEAMLVALARNLRELGFESFAGVFRDSREAHTEVADRAREHGLTVAEIPCRSRWDWRAVHRLKDLLGAYSVDVLHTHGYKADVYACLAAWPKRCALVSTCHNWPSKRPLMRAYASLDRGILRHFDRVVAAGENVAGILRRKKFPESKMATILNGVEPSSFAARQPWLRATDAWQRVPIVGFVGRLVEGKGGHILLRASETILREFPETQFVFAGEGPLLGAWQATARNLGVAANVSFSGFLQNMPAFYASLDMLVLPSFDEATPMWVLEALASGKPVIATSVGELPSLVIPGVTGLQMQPGDAAGLADAILQILRNPELARRMGENGRSHVQQNFSAHAMAKKYLEEYRQVLLARQETRDALEPPVLRI